MSKMKRLVKMTILVPSAPETCIHSLTADSSIDVSFFAARLSFDQRKFILKCYWKFENAVEVQTLPL